jgi:hypothetical protein
MLGLFINLFCSFYFKNFHEKTKKKQRKDTVHKVEFHERRHLSEFTAENWLGVGDGGGGGVGGVQTDHQ